MGSRTWCVAGLAAWCVCLAVVTVWAQDPAPLPANVLSVVAHGTAKAVPDVVKVRLPASTTTPLAADATAQTKKKVDDLIAQLAAAQVPAEAIERSGVSLASASQGYSSEGPSGFTASETVLITLKGLPMDQAPERVAAILDVASRTGGLSVRPDMLDEESGMGAPWGPRGTGLVSFVVSDPEALRAAALQDAVAKARKVAENLAGTLGVKIERVRSVGMAEGDEYADSPMYGLGGGEIGSSSPTSVSLSLTAVVAFDFGR